MDADSQTPKNIPGLRQALVFFLVAVAVGVLGLLLGGLSVGYFAFLLFGILFVVYFSGHGRRLALILYLFLAVGLLTGGLAYDRLNNQETLFQLSSWPLVGSLLERAVVRAGLAILVGAVGAGLVVGLGLWLIIFVSAEWMLVLRKTYGLDRKLAMKLLLYLALGIGRAVIVVDEGEVKSTQPEGPLHKFGAPVVVVVKPYNAIVLVHGTRVSRIEGSDLIRLQKDEEIKAVIDLRPQGQDFALEVLTQDNVPVKVDGSVSFRIEPASETRRQRSAGDHEMNQFKGVIAGPYPVYRSTLYRTAFEVTAGKNWQSQIQGNAGGQVAAAIRGFRVDQIFVVDDDERVRTEMTALQEIIAKAKARAVEAARDWGVQVNGLNIIGIRMPDEAQKAFLARWREPWRGWEEVRKAEAALRGAQFESEATYLKGLRKAQAFEEQFRRTLDVILGQLLDIQDDEMRIKMLLEVIRSLQPVDRRVLNLLLEGRSARRLVSGLTDEGLEGPETEE